MQNNTACIAYIHECSNANCKIPLYINVFCNTSNYNTRRLFMMFVLLTYGNLLIRSIQNVSRFSYYFVTLSCNYMSKHLCIGYNLYYYCVHQSEKEG